MAIEAVRKMADNLKAEVGKVVVGQEDAVEILLVALLSEGHVLMEGVPGTAKTLLAQTFSSALSLDFGRIQFTPDLMPGDVIGTNLFDFGSNSFSLVKGPIFTQFLLADEINRTPPKTQASLLQAMQEREVTIDGKTHSLGDAFMVVATQNPIEQQGTYPLPEAQLDRFLFKHVLTYPSRDQERDVVRRHGARTAMPSVKEHGVRPVGDLDALRAARGVVAGITLSDDMTDYIVDVIRATREHPALAFGASPRAATNLSAAARAYAVLQGRDYVIPDDVKALANPLLRHRVVLSASAEIEGTGEDQVIDQILQQIPVPR
ncbi:MoxR family ATPase [Hwanghaeella grinnelliae]|uniref:MoxR family ATPase n=1 Tax=Hwanghaeella grinnelliae TaxID=2500179 RepID=A0A3S3UR62_9PROT|nr:MoxR family ATPase [Hwanghaeella grinnelliae]RVU38667.1 MoxR family ATPase [Hwanghaeella grinnelliae]